VRTAQILTILIILCQAPAWCDTPLALVTKVEGKAVCADQKLDYLTYLGAGDVVVVSPSSQIALSYVKGGLRATVSGPCRIKMTPEGPTMLEGSASQLHSTQPNRRIGMILPSNLDISSGGTLRRGEISLHVSRQLLPGAHEIGFSALPSYGAFKLSISNSKSLRPTLEQEVTGREPFRIPDGLLQAGQCYDFWLQAVAENGDVKELEIKSVLVLEQPLAEQLEAHRLAAHESSDRISATTELLALYLYHHLDQLALDCAEDLLRNSQAKTNLANVATNLRNQLGLSANL
jgi:hypothetical protein